jgi:chromosome segregation ATPase
MSIKTGSTPLQTVTDLQQKVTDAHTIITDLEKVIAEKEQYLEGLQPSSSTMPQLKMQRENILAALAIGTANQTDLETIDQAITKEQADIDKKIGNNNGAITDTTQALSGLKRKLEEEESKLAELECSRYHSVHTYLLAEAEQIGVEYITAAQKVAVAHRRLLAVDKLLDKHQRGSTITAANPVKLVIPVFNLTAHNGAKSPDFPGVLHEAVKTYQDSTCLDAATRVERERINNSGIRI